MMRSIIMSVARSWKRYLAAFLLNAASALIVLLIKGHELKICYVDAFSVGGAVSVLLGLLIWVASTGAFDTFGYGFSTFRSGRKYKDLYEYTTYKRDKRSRQGKTFLPFILMGGVFLAIAFIAFPSE